MSKKDLAIMLECWSHHSGKINSRRLREKFFTDSVLERIGMTPEEYTSTRTFTRIQTINIIRVLCLEDVIEEYYAKDRS